MGKNNLIQIVPYDQYKTEQACYDVGARVTGYDAENRPIMQGMVTDRLMETRRPDWEHVSDLRQRWERSLRSNLQPLVKQYQAGDSSVLDDIVEGVRTLAYSTAKDFSFDATPDTAVFLNEAGQFDKHIQKAPDTGDPRDETVNVRKLYVQFVPFKFDDDDIEDQIYKTVRTALGNYNPNKGTLFTTWFVRRFQADILNLYKKYKGDTVKIMDMDEYKEKGLSWSNTYISIPDKTDINVEGFDHSELRWLSLVLESYPYELSIKLRSELLGIDSDTDINIRKRLSKKLNKISSRNPGEFTLYMGDKFVGYIILDNSLLTVKGYNDPTPAAVARLMDTETKPRERDVLIPSPVYRWYKNKDGLQILHGSTGEYARDRLFDLDGFMKELNQRLKKSGELPAVKSKDPERKFYVYNHTQKRYCQNHITKWSLLGYLAIKNALRSAGYKIIVNKIQIMVVFGFFLNNIIRVYIY